MEAFSIFHWIIAATFAWVLFRFIRHITIGFKQGLAGKSSGPDQMICPLCGTHGDPATAVRGSIAVEIILWLCLLIPGLIYSVWRQTSKELVCPACHQKGMIPVASPNGKRLSKQFESQ